jgi:hypothetical protein
MPTSVEICRLLRIIAVIAGVCFFSLSTVMAQEVTVTGMGTDRDGALWDASRRAVELVVGTFISSQTLMKDFAIELDEVYKNSQGFVKHVTVLNESRLDDATYKVTAKVDVDTNPDAKLMDTLTMIMRLNDPRIVVAVLERNDEGQVVHNALAESTLNSRLLADGFSHVLDAAQVADLQNVPLLKNLYEGKRGELLGEADHAADFLVIGTYTKDAGKVSIPNYKESGMLETSIVNVKATLKIDVVSYNTGKIAGSFVVEGIGLENTISRAGDKAVSMAAQRAADKLTETLKAHGAKNVQGIEIIMTADNETILQQVIQTLRSLGAVNNVYIREQGGNRAVLTVDSSYKPHEIVGQLRKASACGIAVESMQSDSCQLRIT